MAMEISGIDSAKRRLRQVAERAANPEPGLRKLADMFEDHVSETFDSRGRSIGRTWKPLSADWVDMKARMTADPRPLVLSGGLLESFKAGRWHIERMSNKQIRWGSRHPLAHLHQRGTPGRRVSARPMLKATPDLRKKARDELGAWIARG